MSVCGLLSCNLAFVCRQIIDCNDDCLWRESEANGFRRQNFRVELVIVDGLLFVGSQLSKSYDGDDKYFLNFSTLFKLFQPVVKVL